MRVERTLPPPLSIVGSRSRPAATAKNQQCRPLLFKMLILIAVLLLLLNVVMLDRTNYTNVFQFYYSFRQSVAYGADKHLDRRGPRPSPSDEHSSVADEQTMVSAVQLLDPASNNGSASLGNDANSTVLTATIENSSSRTTAAVRLMTQQPSLPMCPLVPPVLVGPIKVWFDYPSWAELRKLYPFVEAGGHSKPKECLSRHRVAVIIPYRDRERHLRGFLHNMHSLLTKQQLDYSIFVIEQVSGQTFNRAKLMNVGVKESLALYDWQCFIFHDVDLLPEDDRNLYTCPEQPRHMSVAIDKFKYKLPYGDIFGGVSALTREQIEKVNGFPNDYWGWGGEDDDIAVRVKLAGYKLSRYPADVSRYKMIKHTQHSLNPINKCRYKLMYKTKERWRQDGLSNLSYQRRNFSLEPLFTHVRVDLLEAESRKSLAIMGLKC